MLYHMNLGFPKDLRLELPDYINLTWSKHAIQAAQSDRYGAINLINKLSTKQAQIIELELVNNQIIKIVLRVPYNDKTDLCLALVNGGHVKTVWLNLKTDTHKTLDLTKYTRVI